MIVIEFNKWLSKRNCLDLKHLVPTNTKGKYVESIKGNVCVVMELTMLKNKVYWCPAFEFRNSVLKHIIHEDKKIKSLALGSDFITRRFRNVILKFGEALNFSTY